MKILLWPTMYFPNIGGLERMVHSLAKALQRRGHEILILSNSERKNAFSIEGIPVFTFPFIKILFNYQLSLLRQTLSEVSGLIDTFSPDVVNIHGWFECFAFYQTRILDKRAIPICLTLHGLLEQKNYQTENCMKLWQRAVTVNTVSHAIVPPKYHPFLQTIHNGLPLPKASLKPLPKNRLLLAGRLSEEKCFHIAFLALKLLLPQYPDLQLTLLGDGPSYKALSQLKKQLDLPVEMPRFVHPGTVQDFIDRATVILIPSSYESFSLIALEAALRGRPVIASRVLGLKEVVEDQKTGLLVKPQDPVVLAKAVDALLSHPSQMKQMGKTAFERASRLFNIETTTNNYLKMYEKASHLRHYSCA